MRIDLPSTSGVYIIRNRVNGYRYIGESVNMQRRVYDHAKALRNVRHKNYRLQYAYNFYGGNSFEVFCLEECEIEDLMIREQYWLDELCPEYNLVYTPRYVSSSARPSTKSTNVALTQPYFHRRHRKSKDRENEFYKDDEIFPRPAWHKKVYGTLK